MQLDWVRKYWWFNMPFQSEWIDYLPFLLYLLLQSTFSNPYALYVSIWWKVLFQFHSVWPCSCNISLELIEKRKLLLNHLHSSAALKFHWEQSPISSGVFTTTCIVTFQWIVTANHQLRDMWRNWRIFDLIQHGIEMYVSDFTGQSMVAHI